MNLTQATAVLGQFFRGTAGGCALSPDRVAELRAAWAVIEPELPNKDRITSIWDIGDVGTALEDNFNVPPDTLTDDQKRQVLKEVQDNTDASNGINWAEINAAIESLFSDVVEEAQAEQEKEDGP